MILRNKKQELFVKYLSQGMKQNDAYTKSGYRSNPSNASQLANTPKIKRRLAEVMGSEFERVENRLAIMKEDIEKDPDALLDPVKVRKELLIGAREAHAVAISERKAGEAIKCLLFIAQLSGLEGDRRKRPGPAGSAAVDKPKETKEDAITTARLDEAMDALNVPEMIDDV